MRKLLNLIIPNKAINKPLLNKYDQPFFVNTSIQKEIAQNGFSVVDMITEKEIKELSKDFNEILSRNDTEFDKLFWNSGRVKSVAVRNLARKSIEKNIKPNLEKFFLPEKTDLMGGVFVVKPPGSDGGLNPHQDSSHVEEDKYISVYAWCPMTEVNENNGALCVIPGSHLWGNKHRSLNIPWQFEPYIKELWDFAIPLNVKAGQVVFFDSATIHCSKPNLSKEIRIATNFFIKQSSADFLHYFSDQSNPEKIEKYKVDMDFFYNKNFLERPPQEYPFVGEEKYSNLKLNRKILLQLFLQNKSHEL